MAFIPSPNVMQIILQGTLYGSVIQNTLYFKKADSSAFTQSDFATLASAVEGWYNANIVNVLSDDVGFNTILGYDQTSQSAPAYSQPATISGNVLNTSAPGNVAFSVSFKTGNRGRSGRGRNYVAGIPELYLTGNNTQAVFYNGILNGYTALISAAATAGFVWGVLSKYSNGVPRASGLFQPVTTVTIANVQVDSQRKRVTQA